MASSLFKRKRFSNSVLKSARAELFVWIVKCSFFPLVEDEPSPVTRSSRTYCLGAKLFFNSLWLHAYGF